jgi:hypothetical protein
VDFITRTTDNECGPYEVIITYNSATSTIVTGELTKEQAESFWTVTDDKKTMEFFSE